MNLKIERLNSVFIKEISSILKTEVKDPNINFVTITGCEITNDLINTSIKVILIIN